MPITRQKPNLDPFRERFFIGVLSITAYADYLINYDLFAAVSGKSCNPEPRITQIALITLILNHLKCCI